MAELTRRGFLALGGLATAAMVLDPERALWVPGARTFFLPSTQLVEAATLDEALSKGLVAVFPDGSRIDLVVRGLAWSIAREVAAVEQMGGRVVANRQWTEHEVRASDPGRYR